MTPQPSGVTITPTPFVPSQEPPLQIDVSAATASVEPGQSLSFTVVVRSSEAASVSVEASVGGQAQVIDAASPAGSCQAGPTVRCG